jgi:hypothetical protein
LFERDFPLSDLPELVERAGKLAAREGRLSLLPWHQPYPVAASKALSSIDMDPVIDRETGRIPLAPIIGALRDFGVTQEHVEAARFDMDEAKVPGSGVARLRNAEEYWRRDFLARQGVSMKYLDLMSSRRPGVSSEAVRVAGEFEADLRKELGSDFLVHNKLRALRSDPAGALFSKRYWLGNNAGIADDCVRTVLDACGFSAPSLTTSRLTDGFGPRLQRLFGYNPATNTSFVVLNCDAPGLSALKPAWPTLQATTSGQVICRVEIGVSHGERPLFWLDIAFGSQAMVERRNTREFIGF